MAANFLNYILMIIGVLAIMTAVIMILLDKLKGEDLYFNLDVKQQEMKKVIEDAEEIISELNYISDVVVQEIEDKMKGLKESYDSIKVPSAVQEPQRPVIAAIPVTLKQKTTPEKQGKEKDGDLKLNAKQRAVFDYSNQGMSIVEIAKLLNIGQGEVKLILSLKNEVAADE